VPGRSRARWGWYRLADGHAAELVARSGVGRGDLVLDLGAGEGAITRHLVGSGARVVAFELHPDRARRLRTSFPGLRVVRADVTDLRLPRRPFRVVANPPFDGVSAVLARLTHRHSRLAGADVVVPAAVARRWRSQLHGSSWRATVIAALPRRAFDPAPRVDCVILRIEPGSVRR
jgi:23S rRNA (adenine-N6)-dimethyltransferase